MELQDMLDLLNVYNNVLIATENGSGWLYAGPITYIDDNDANDYGADGNFSMFYHRKVTSMYLHGGRKPIEGTVGVLPAGLAIIIEGYENGDL